MKFKGKTLIVNTDQNKTLLEIEGLYEPIPNFGPLLIDEKKFRPIKIKDNFNTNDQLIIRTINVVDNNYTFNNQNDQNNN